MDKTQNQFEDIFKHGSRTFYYSSLLFPKDVRTDVTALYAFVRTADDFVDKIPQDTLGFLDFYDDTLQAMKEGASKNPIIHAFIDVYKRKKIKQEWVTDFLDAMKDDLTKNTYNTFTELEKYMHGSAEVVGLMMAAVMNLKEESYPAAKHLGKSLQLLNFIRDIQEDIQLGRRYIPLEDLKEFGVTSIPPKKEELAQFIQLIHFELNRYFEIQKKAEEGFRYISRPYKVPVMTASDMYKWTAKEIYKDPMIIFQKKVKPSVTKILLTLMSNTPHYVSF